MSTALSVFLAQVDYLISAQASDLVEAARQAMIEAAVEKYSHDAPGEKTADVTGDGGNYYAVASSLTDWVEGFSRIVEIEYPAATIASDEAPQYLDREDWRDDYWYNSARYLYLPNHAPAATEKMRITHTIPYTWSDDEDPTTDTPTQDFFAICHLAAALCCQALAAKYAKIGDSTIGADSVAHTTKSTEYSRRAQEFLNLYNDHLGLVGGGDKEQGAGDFIDWDTAPSWPSGRKFIFHHGGVR